MRTRQLGCIIVTTLVVTAGCVTTNPHRTKGGSDYETLVPGYSLPRPNPKRWELTDSDRLYRRWQPRAGGMTYVTVKLTPVPAGRTLEQSRALIRRALLAEFPRAKVRSESASQLGSTTAIDMQLDVETTSGDTIRIRQVYALGGEYGVAVRHAGLQSHFEKSTDLLDKLRSGFQMPAIDALRQAITLR